jgi:transposase
MEAYPQKIRDLVLDASANGVKTATIAEQLKVGRSWVRGVKQRLRESQLRNAINQKHGPDPKLTEADRLQLAKLVEQTPDATLKELHKQFNMPVSISTIVRALNDMKLTLKKKSLHASEQNRLDVKLKREEWEQCMPGLDLDKVVFYDEIGVNTKMVRLHGRCPASQRLVDFAPAGHYSSNTLMSGMRLSGVVAPMLLDSAVNGESFAGYVEQCLAPALEPGDILIIDNLPAHKSARVTAAIENAGCILVYLPPYSPDLNPIENMWSKVKASVRAAAARTLDAVVDAVDIALRSVTESDREGYFNHCGYGGSPT